MLFAFPHFIFLNCFAVFARFLAVNEQLLSEAAPAPSGIPAAVFASPARYSEVKKQATEYQVLQLILSFFGWGIEGFSGFFLQMAKSRLNVALYEAGCGHWIEKPVEQDQFSM